MLRGFHNVCRHRAAALLEQGSGSCNALRCPYHGWSYAEDGSLVGLANFGDDPELDLSEYGLFPIRVEVWRGLIFVCLDDQALDLSSWLGRIPEFCQGFPGSKNWVLMPLSPSTFRTASAQTEGPKETQLMSFRYALSMRFILLAWLAFCSINSRLLLTILSTSR